MVKFIRSHDMTKKPNQIPDLPYGRLGIVALCSVTDLALKVDDYIIQKRKKRLKDYMQNGLFSDDTSNTYLIDSEIVRFSDGEGKCQLTR